MSQFMRPPDLGPIVGHTQPDSVRLWMRAEDGDGRTVGVAALYLNGAYVSGTARYFRLQREYDRTGTVDFDGLVPDTAYTARLGSIRVDSTADDVLVTDKEVEDRLPPSGSWEPDLRRLDAALSTASFTTFPAAPESFSFVFGSCRYPGVLLFRKHADEIFHAMQEVAAREGQPRFALMIGDQIYADLLNRAIPLGRAEGLDEFHSRYREAFGARYLRAQMQRTPTYMMLDDHEIEDNWCRGRLRDPGKRTVFNHAIHAYMGYQWVHGPRSEQKRLYYRFDCAGCPFFVLDQRTERIRDDDDDQKLADNHLLGYPAKGAFRGQLDVFCDWLVEMQGTRGDVPKFVVSPSVFAPNDVATLKKPWESDSWPAFPETRRRVLQTIANAGVQNVIFLSGDVHCSSVADIWLTDDGRRLPLKMWSVTSSAFYWPFPFADGDPLSFVHDADAEGDVFDVTPPAPATGGTPPPLGLQMHYQAWNFEQDDNFTRVEVDLVQRELRIRVFGRKGNELKSDVLRLA